MAEQIEFLDDLKIVDVRDMARRAVGAVQGFLALGTTTELCLSEHANPETPEEAK